MQNKCILIVEDEPDLRELLVLTVIKMGYKILEAENITRGIEYINKHNDQQQILLTLTDMRLPDGLGMEIVRHCTNKSIPSIVMTAYGNTDTAIQALKLGAIDYLTKPVSIDALRKRIAEVLDTSSNNELNINKNNNGANNQQDLDKWLIGNSLPMQAVKKTILQYSQSLAPVMITGESGTGKERVAKAIHMYSKRKGQFVAVNCGAIPENLMESEFFGVIKGAFTGANQARNGLFEEANNGTLFLDEIAELPLHMQTKLLRVLQERTIRPLGSNQEHKIDVRIICATHKNIQEMTKNNTFRNDLYYRIHVLPLYLPNLLQRKEDIPLLVNNILNLLNKTYNQNKKISDKALNQLENHQYEGNIRELENLLEASYAINLEKIENIYNLDKNSSQSPLQHSNESNINNKHNLNHLKFPINLPLVLADIEKEYILKALNVFHHNQSATAKSLSLTLRQLRYKLEQLGIYVNEKN